jgi:hypothetical protein
MHLAVLIEAIEHHEDHAREHQRHLHRKHRAGRDDAEPEEHQERQDRDEHRRRHLAAALPVVTAVAHPEDHRQRHVEGHRKGCQLDVIVPGGIEAGAEDQKMKSAEPDTEDAHPQHHRDRHLEQMPDEGASPRAAPPTDAVPSTDIRCESHSRLLGGVNHKVSAPAGRIPIRITTDNAAVKPVRGRGRIGHDQGLSLDVARRDGCGAIGTKSGQRRTPGYGVDALVAVRAPHLYRSLRNFCLGAFRTLLAELEEGADLPFAFEEHSSLGRPALYEYRPLVRPFVETRAYRLARRDDARIALDDLRREPAAAIFARAHAGARPSEDDALFGSVLLPLLIETAEISGGFDWDDGAYDRAYVELETSLFGRGHAYAAVAPLVGVTLGGQQIELGNGIRVRVAATGELAKMWPEANGLLPPDFGREPDRLSVLELERALQPGETEPPDAPGELSDAVTALRLATAAPVAAGPVLFERLDWRPYGIRPVLPIAATQPVGDETRLDSFRGALAADLLPRLAAADDDPDLGEALDRWELSLFQDGPFQAEQLRESLVALLGGTDGVWAAVVRGAILLGEDGRERAEMQEQLAGDPEPDAVRRALVETLLRGGDRPTLVRMLDETILGLRPAPAARPPSIARALAG